MNELDVCLEAAGAVARELVRSLPGNVREGQMSPRTVVMALRRADVREKMQGWTWGGDHKDLLVKRAKAAGYKIEFEDTPGTYSSIKGWEAI